MYINTRNTPLRSHPLLGWFTKHYAGGLDVGIYKHLGQQTEAETLTQHFERIRNEWRKEMELPLSPYTGMSRSEIISFKRKSIANGQVPEFEALDELLFYAGIKTKGMYTDVIENAFKLGDVDVLVPEVIANRVHYSMLATSLLPMLIMNEIAIAGTEYRKVYIADTEADRQTAVMARSADLPEIKVAISKQNIALHRYGAYVKLNYDDWKYETFGALNAVLDLIGSQIDVDRTDDALTVFQNGDGNSNTPYTSIETDTTGTVVLADVIESIIKMPAPYRPDNAIGKAGSMALWLAVVYGMNQPWDSYNGGLKIPQAHVWDRSCITSDLVLLQDSRFSMQYITQDSMLVESENIVRRSEKGFAISYRGYPAIFDRKANAYLDITH
jgi:hypothetical protein